MVDVSIRNSLVLKALCFWSLLGDRNVQGYIAVMFHGYRLAGTLPEIVEAVHRSMTSPGGRSLVNTAQD